MRKIKKLVIFLCTFLISIETSYLCILDKLKDKYNYVGILIDKEKYKSAIEIGKEVLDNHSEKLDDFEKSRLLNNIGFCYYKLGKYKEAYNFYSRAIELDQNYLLCLNNISAVLIKLKKYLEAIRYLERALVLNDNNVKVLFNMFVAYANLKDAEMAKEYLKKAFEIDRNYTIKRLKSNGVSEKKIEEIKRFLEYDD